MSGQGNGPEYVQVTHRKVHSYGVGPFRISGKTPARAILGAVGAVVIVVVYLLLTNHGH